MIVADMEIKIVNSSYEDYLQEEGVEKIIFRKNFDTFEI